MNTYGDIIKRLSEIIILSDQKREELIANGENIDSFFERKLFRPIFKEYISEFKDLLIAEETFWTIKNNLERVQNKELISECDSKINEQSEFVELKEILTKAYNHRADELILVGNYLILKEDKDRFNSICKKLEVGSHKKNWTKEDMSFDRLKEQKNRVEAAIAVMTKNGSEEVKDISDNAEIETKEYNSGLIILAINGYLSLEMIECLKNTMKLSEYDDFIKSLEALHIYPEDELAKVSNKPKIETWTNADEILKFLLTKDDLIVSGLKAFKPIIGEYNYNYLIEELYNYGRIDLDEYIDLLDKNEPMKKV